VTPVLTPFVTDDGTFADPQFDGRALLRPAQGPAQSTDAWPRGQQHRTLRQRRDRLRWLLVSQSLGPLVVGPQLMQPCTEAQLLGRRGRGRRLPTLTGAEAQLFAACRCAL
jgi:hypothetical protein